MGNSTKFMGFRRSNGEIGIRNHVLVFSISGCSSGITSRVVNDLYGAVSFVNPGGCCETVGDMRTRNDALLGMIRNPNVYGAVIIGIGCEKNQMSGFLDMVHNYTDKPLNYLLIQEEGGTINSIAKATRYAQEMISKASEQQREDGDLSEILMGLECGASDGSSALVANPLVGRMSDRVIAAGGTAVLTETMELFGAEYVLAKKAASKEVGQQIIDAVHSRNNYLIANGEDVRKSKPSKGNIEGGISTLEEKAFGCTFKGGNNPIVEVIKSYQRPSKKGLVFMETSGYDLVSITAKASSGCHLTLFTTGAGSPTGCSVMPLIKITANPDTYERMKDNIDFDASGVLRKTCNMDELADQLYSELLKTLNGKLTKAEIYKFGYNEMVVNRKCDYF